MTRRYFVPDLPDAGGLVSLPPAEVQHATRVMRVQLGDEITLFDGKGNETSAVVSGLARNECHCEAQKPELVNRETKQAIHLAVALPKYDRARELVERLTELGTKSLTPIVASRTQRPPSESQLEKLRRAVVESCKQCGRNQLMEITPAIESNRFFAGPHEGVRLIAHQNADAHDLKSISAPETLIAAIGPEGGWTDQEVQLAQEHGFQPIDLGPRIYRIETAATVVAVVSSQ